jgi:hypothetical protein
MGRPRPAEYDEEIEELDSDRGRLALHSDWVSWQLSITDYSSWLVLTFFAILNELFSTVFQEA